MNLYFVSVMLLLAVDACAEELPDISTVVPDLIVPEMTTGAPVELTRLEKSPVRCAAVG